MKIQTNLKVEKEFYQDAKVVFSNLGLSFGDAVNIFLAKVAAEKAIPFALEIPSNELSNRIENINKNKNTQVFDSVDELFSSLS
ncbi:MAG: type II toxin-antitoxin system RelB/DinJ family antitoxin [Candidatus Thioglobus sp.]|nr:type II toxin-antitoxin system RelB/DinJ family antitoxin [Candidatus Thioglobus sp.]